ncbi:MAG: 6-carboxytetrahydropterin synthase [Candidatus Omnitrophota bacterium]
MYRVTCVIHFCYGHRLLNYDGKCNHFHGHNGKLEIQLEAKKLDPRGMVLDFQDIKLAIKQWVDENLDHRMILNRKDPLLQALIKAGEPVFTIDGNPTAEAIAKIIYDHTISQGFPTQEVRLWETESSSASYRP